MNILGRLQAWGQWLTTDPLGFIVYILYLAVAVLAALILHEVAHGYVAYRCGDPTAKLMGRLSLNPAKHLDPIGTACLVLFGFGWAKPVPVNPRNFGNYRRDEFLVSVAGVTVNLTLYLLSTILALALTPALWRPEVLEANGGLRAFVSSSGIGYRILLSGYGQEYAQYMQTPWLQYVLRFLLLFGSINLGLGVFNLLPIPPLDGYHVLNDVILNGKLDANPRFTEICRFALLALCLTGLLGTVLSYVTGAVENGVIGLFLLITGQG